MTTAMMAGAPGTMGSNAHNHGSGAVSLVRFKSPDLHSPAVIRFVEAGFAGVDHEVRPEV